MHSLKNLFSRFEFFCGGVLSLWVQNHCMKHMVNLLIVLSCLGFDFVAGISSHFPKTFLAIFVGNVHTDLHDSSVNLRVLACRCPCPQHELLCTCHATCIRGQNLLSGCVSVVLRMGGWRCSNSPCLTRLARGRNLLSCCVSVVLRVGG